MGSNGHDGHFCYHQGNLTCQTEHSRFGLEFVFWGQFEGGGGRKERRGGIYEGKRVWGSVGRENRFVVQKEKQKRG
jgi:hypothetical protein